MSRTLRFGILGKGRAGTALWRSAEQAKNRQILAFTNRVEKLGEPGFWQQCNLYLIAVPDDALEDVAAQLARKRKLPPLIAHTSGVKGPSALASISAAHPDVAVGCFHPLASLDGHAPLPEGALIAVDAVARTKSATNEALAILNDAARRFRCRPARVPEKQRALYHAGAVVAGNLPVALLALGVRLLEDAGVPADLARISLARLLKSQSENAIERDLAKALTGPVARGDAKTLAMHLAALDATHRDTAAVYRALSEILVDDVAAHPAAVKRVLRGALR